MLDVKVKNVVKAIESIPGLENAIVSKFEDRTLEDLVSVSEAGGRIRDVICYELDNMARHALTMISSLDITRNQAIAYCILDDYYAYMITGQDNLPDTYLDWEL